MKNLKKEQKKIVEKSCAFQKTTLLNRILILSLITLFTGLGGYFIFLNSWIRYIFAHSGALGVIGLLSYLAGVIAEKKKLDLKKAVLTSLFSSIFLGIIATYLVAPYRENGLPQNCGGVVSLGISLSIVIIYIIIKKRKIGV